MKIRKSKQRIKKLKTKKLKTKRDKRQEMKQNQEMTNDVLNEIRKKVQKRVKTCKTVHLKYSFIKKNVQKRAKTCKNVHLKYFWTQFKNVHLRGPCSLRPCISRPYCTQHCEDAPDLKGYKKFHLGLPVFSEKI